MVKYIYLLKGYNIYVMSIKDILKKALYHGGLYFTFFLALYSLVSLMLHHDGAGIYATQALLFIPACFIFAFANVSCKDSKLSRGKKLSLHFLLTSLALLFAFFEAIASSNHQRIIIIIALYVILYFFIYAAIAFILHFIANRKQ